MNMGRAAAREGVAMTKPEEAACKATRALDVVNAGPRLRDDAAALTEDVNEAYLLVHETVSRALSAPGCDEVSAYALSQGMSDRFVDAAADGPEDV